MMTKRPNFLIIGAAKCGTSSLAAILGDHPECCMSRPKEVCFFQDQMDFKPNPNFDKGWEWYQKAFSHYDGEPKVGDATPSYSDRTRSPKTAKRIFDFDPKMQLLYLVRDPLDRQYSAWQMQHFEGLQGIHPDRIETQWALEGFDRWMREQKAVGQWDIARYDYQLNAYREYFANDSILVSFLEDWKTDQLRELQRICHFLDLDPNLLSVKKPEGENRAADKSVEPSWFRRLRENKAVRTVGKLAPTAVKRKLGVAVGKRPQVESKSQLSEDVRSEFLSHVQADATRLLTSQNKPITLWPTLSHTVAS